LLPLAFHDVLLKAISFFKNLNDYKQFFNNLQQKYSAQTPEVAIQPIIDAESQEIQKRNPKAGKTF
jgi:hypothetical protein